jgi:hypothetical protein
VVTFPAAGPENSAEVGRREGSGADPVPAGGGSFTSTQRGPGPAPAPYLESESPTPELKVTGVTGRVQCKRLGCGSVWCGCGCGMQKALALRDSLKVELESFASPYFITLTLNPDRFPAEERERKFLVGPPQKYVVSGPELALAWVQEQGCISEFVRSLRRRGSLSDHRYFACLEFQENGWPHWHLVFDAEFVPFDEIVEAWTAAGWSGRAGLTRWGPRPKFEGKGSKPAFGGVRFRVRGKGELGRLCHYLTKYLTKIPDLASLEWVRQRSSVRRWSTSRDFWRTAPPPREPRKVTEFSKLRGKYYDRNEEWVEDDEFLRKIKKSSKTIGQRLQSCGSCSVVLEEVTCERADAPGVPFTKWQWVGMIKAPVWNDPHEASSTFNGRGYVDVDRTSFVVDHVDSASLLRILAGALDPAEAP